jgi:hypothetical protein
MRPLQGTFVVFAGGFIVEDVRTGPPRSHALWPLITVAPRCITETVAGSKTRGLLRGL